MDSLPLLGGPALHRRAPLPNDAAERLGAIPWDFSNANGDDLAGIHPYPAKFIPEIPGALLDVLPPPPGTAVLDPFCGSGTTLVEAQARGITAIGIDLNPIAVLISKVKTSAVPPSLGRSLSVVVEQAIEDHQPSIPHIPRLDHWFKRPVQLVLAALSAAIATAPAEHRDILRLAMASIVVRVSNQDSDTRYAAVDKNVTREAVFKFFVRATKRIIEALERRNYALVPARVIERDILATPPSMLGGAVGLVITSPPYPNAYEYWLYHKYRMWWLGFDPIAVREQEIGARAHFFGGKGHKAHDFARQMRGSLKLIADALVPDGHACFVVGRSQIHGVVVDNAEVITEVGASFGFEPVFSTERTILANRKSFNLAHANIKTETVLVLRRNAASVAYVPILPIRANARYERSCRANERLDCYKLQ